MKLRSRVYRMTTPAEFSLVMFYRERAYAVKARGNGDNDLARLYGQFARRWYSEYLHAASLRAES